MRCKTKRRRRRYDRISLHYINLDNSPPETYADWAVLWRDLDNRDALEEWRNELSCRMGLRLKLNGSVLWSACLISELVDIALGRAEHLHGVRGEDPVENIERGSADYWPFVCFECGDSGCAGVWVPLRVFQCGKDIIFGVRRPLEGVEPGHRTKIRAYRLRRRDLLDALINAIKFRFAIERVLQEGVDEHASDVRKYEKLLTSIFGLSDCGDYQQRISKWLHDDYPRLLDLRLSLSDRTFNIPSA